MARAAGDGATIRVNARHSVHDVSPWLTGACIEDVNHEIYGGIYSQMIFGESFAEPSAKSTAKGAAASDISAIPAVQISRMWEPVQRGSAVLAASLIPEGPFGDTQCQRIAFTTGTGDAGIANRGLNHWGMAFTANKPYEGYVWMRAAAPTQVSVSLENRAGDRSLATKTIAVEGDQWKRYDFQLTPEVACADGRFEITLSAAGSMDIGRAFLQPGEWGRFKGLPVRRDVVEGLIDQGVSVLRYGGSMVNAQGYRWKNMIGPRDRRPIYKGTWYRWSSNGWGIVDFLNLCEAMHILGVPDFNINESPADMADFIEYVNGAVDTPWGRRRAADGHSSPYHLTHIELGNEERVDDVYYGKFAALARAIWKVDPAMILVVGDFAYDASIGDAMHVTGAASRITSLAAHRRILELAAAQKGQVWFDVHVWTDKPGISTSLRALPSYIDAIDSLAGSAKHKVVVFELNSGNHLQRRALANAQAIEAAQRDGRLPIVCSANCLQCDGQNNNGWDQGLLFLNPSQVWLQPPGYVTRMIARAYEPRVLDARVESGTPLDVTATASQDGRTIVIQVVNASDKPVTAAIDLDGFSPMKGMAEVNELAGPLDADNTARDTQRIMPRARQWAYSAKTGKTSITFGADSFTVIRFQ
jgi:alpha-L-arabinofuranosidase